MMTDQGRIARAEELYTRTYSGQLTRSFMVDSLRRVVRTSLPHAEGVIAAENEDWARGLIEKGMFSDQPPESIVASFAEQTASCIQSAGAVVEAASLVFSISGLETTVYDLCRVSVLVRPSDWLGRLDNKQVTLRDIRTSTPEELLEKGLQDYVGKLERKSLLEKLDALLSVCHPPPGWMLAGVAKYDRETVRQLDDLRNEIVHGSLLQKDWAAIGVVDLYYIRFLEIGLMHLITERFGIKVNPHTFLRIRGADQNGL